MHGHGVFIYEPSVALKKYGSWGAIASAIQKMKMTHAWVRGHDKKGLFQPKDNLNLVKALQSAGIKVFVWGWCQGDGQIEQDIKNAADAIAKFAPDGYVADIEEGVSGARWKASTIDKFLSATRMALGGKPLILSTHGFIPYHKPELMQVAEPYVDAFAPQVYWFWYPSDKMMSEPGAKGPYKVDDAAAYANLCLDVWRHVTRKPIILTGQAYWGESAKWHQADAEKKLEEFVRGFSRFGEIAGLNWWHLAGEAAMSPKMEDLIAEANFQAKLEAARDAGARPVAVPAMLEALNGEVQPLEVIAPLSDTSLVLENIKPRVVQAGKTSAIARYDWRNRGPACIGYTAGMAISYAAAYARLQGHDPVADHMARVMEPAFQDAHGRLKGDALTWYDEQFRAINMGGATPVERLRRLFVLLLGLGMRESSGRYCEGRDRSATNIAANTAEAGLFQMSFDLVAPRAELLDIFHHYLSNPEEGLREVFEQEVSPPPRPKDLENFGPADSVGFAFQRLSKECPAMAVEIAGLGLRAVAGHWGPIINHAVEVRTASKELLLAVERIVDEPVPPANLAAMPAAAQPVIQLVTADGVSRADISRSYMQRLDLDDLLPINSGLTSAKERTMVSLLGSPNMPLTTTGQSERASNLVKRNLVTEKISPLFRLTGLKPAIADVKAVLAQAFDAHPDLENVLSTEGMLSVRMRKPTDGSVSRQISNHAWGTAVDFKIVGFEAPGNSGQTVPQFIAVLIPLFNAAGWYSGVAFRDSMHFEVSEQRIRKWANERVLS